MVRDTPGVDDRPASEMYQTFTLEEEVRDEHRIADIDIWLPKEWMARVSGHDMNSRILVSFRRGLHNIDFWSNCEHCGGDHREVIKEFIDWYRDTPDGARNRIYKLSELKENFVERVGLDRELKRHLRDEIIRDIAHDEETREKILGELGLTSEMLEYLREATVESAPRPRGRPRREAPEPETVTA